MLESEVGMNRIQEWARERRSQRLIEILHKARRSADWARKLAADTPFLDAGERERIRRAVIPMFVRGHLISTRLSIALAIGFAVTWPLLGVLGVAATMAALAVTTGLAPHLSDGVAIGFGTYTAPLWVPFIAATAAGLLLAVPRWGKALGEIKRWRQVRYRIFRGVSLSMATSLPGVAVILLTGLPGLVCTAAIVNASSWGAHDRTGVALGCGLVAGLSGNLWSRQANRAASSIFRSRARLVQGDKGLLAMVGCVDLSTLMLDGSWRRPAAVREFRLDLNWWAAYAQQSRIAFKRTRWFEWRERAHYRRRYRMLGAIIRSHASTALAANTAADWEPICQSLVSGLMLVVDEDWDAIIAAYALLPRRDRWITRLAPRLLTAAVTGCGAVFLPLLPGLGGAAGSSVRVFLGIAAVLALLPAGEGYDPVRSAVSSSLPWRGGPK